MIHSEEITEVSAAFVAAQEEFEAVSKDADNPYFNSKYADITSILGMVRPIFAKHGLALIQSCSPSTDGVNIQTVVLHASGQYLADDYLHVPAAKQDPQGYGGAITYARRYAMLAFLCLATEDDDGNAASQAMTKAEAARARRG
jgi:hypothetical protein